MNREALQRVRLTARFHLWQRSRGHRSATDDVLCAWAAVEARPHARAVLDLGAGQGAVTLMLAGALPDATLQAVEVQEASFELLARNIAENGLGARALAVRADLRALEVGRSFDLVTGTPPFLRPGAGLPSRDPQRAAARFELCGGIEDYCLAASRALRDGGIASFLMDAAQDERCRRAVSGAGLHLTARVEVLPSLGARPRFIVYQMAHRAPPRVAEHRFAVRDAAGRWTRQFRAVRARLDLPGARERTP
jgi:tRNA1Val (adenine37-N6)-methyltransferase